MHAVCLYTYQCICALLMRCVFECKWFQHTSPSSQPAMERKLDMSDTHGFALRLDSILIDMQTSQVLGMIFNSEQLLYINTLRFNAGQTTQ